MYRFVWKIKLYDPDSEQAFIDHWRTGSTIIQKFSGALGTHLHRVRDEKGSFFAVAEWQSKEARDAMQAELDAGTTEQAKLWQKLPTNESFGQITSFAGEELDQVLPIQTKQFDHES